MARERLAICDTLAVLAPWPRFRSERDFWRFAQDHLRDYFPTLPSQSQFNRRMRSLQGQMSALQEHLARELSGGSELYHILDTTLIPAVVRVRACRKGLFAGEATFGRCVSKTEWIYGFKVGLTITPEGVITTFCLAEAAADERPIGDVLIRGDGHGAYLADKGFSSVDWERRWLAENTELWWQPPPKTIPAGRGRKRIVVGLLASARSSRGL